VPEARKLMPLYSSVAPGRTLVIVASVPGSRNVGQILLREMLRCVDADRFVIAALIDPNSEDAQAAESLCEMRMFACPKENAKPRVGGRFGGVVGAIQRVNRYEPEIGRVSREVLRFAQQSGISRIWAILDSTAAIDVSAALIRKMDVPVLAHVWDDVEHLTRQRRLDAFTRRRTAARFARVLTRSRCTAVIGDAMGENYARRFGVRWQVIRQGVADQTLPREERTRDGEFVIGFSGGMYCPSAWKALLDALGQVGWTIGGRPVRLVVMSGHVWFSTRSPTNIQFKGWVPEAEAHRTLASCDLLYLPQPFEPAQRPLAELSFPTKLSAYVSTGRPVFVHAPKYASLVAFAQTHPVGPLCSSRDPAVVAKTLEAFASSATAYADAARASADVANTVLSRASFVAQVQAFLAADDDGADRPA